MLTAVIDGAACIGCGRCVPACPVDAILGAQKFMHTVLLDECIGCKLCIEPCPVDCISMRPLMEVLPVGEEIDRGERIQRAKVRHQAKQARLRVEAQRLLPVVMGAEERRAAIREEIAAAVARVADKRSESIG